MITSIKQVMGAKTESAPLEDPFTQKYIRIMEKREDFDRLADACLDILETAPNLRGIIFRESYIYHLGGMIEILDGALRPLQGGYDTHDEIDGVRTESLWRPRAPWPFTSTEERWKQAEIARLQSEIAKYQQEIADMGAAIERLKEAGLAADVPVASAATGSSSGSGGGAASSGGEAVAAGSGGSSSAAASLASTTVP